jgi:CO/xanthine dehydrogenase Mo-binding subunit
VMSVDESSVAGMPGLVKVVVKKNFVGVVAEKPWQALQAAGKLKVTWSSGSGLANSADFYEQLRNQKPTRDILLVDSKDLEQKLDQAAAVVKATYLHPYQAHGSMGSSCAVADVQGDQATIWSPTQGVWYQRSTAAMVLGLKPENVRVIFRRGSGCYGLNAADTVTYDAALLSQAAGKPVRVQLTRQDELTSENYGNAFLMDERAGLDAQGNIIAWEHEAWSPTLGNRPGPGTPGNVITGSRQDRPRPNRGVLITTATEFLRMPLLCLTASPKAPALCVARACWFTIFRRLSSPARCDLPRASRTRSRTSPSWTNWRRTPRQTQWSTACAI